MNEQTILDTINEIDDKHSIGWDTDSTLTILARFIAANCKLEDFKSFVEETAKDELQMIFEEENDNEDEEISVEDKD